MDGTQQILVHRKRLLKSTQWAVSNPNFTFRKSLKVVFSGEMGEDSGGPKREFFSQLMREVETDITTGQTRNKVFKHDLQKLQDNVFEKSGKLVSWSLLHGGPGLPVLNGELFDLMISNDCRDVNLDAVDLDTRNVMEALRITETENQFQTVLKDHFDWFIDQGMVVYGKTLQNKQELINTLFKNSVFYRTHAEITQFIDGLNSVGNLFDHIQTNPILMRRVLVNESSDLTFDQLRTLYKILFSEEGSNNRDGEEDTIYAFEAFLMNAEAGQTGVTLHDVLSFWTGASDIPPLGFAKKLEVTFVNGDEIRLPVAHTCGMVLELPRGISDPQRFGEAMTKAITWCGGFHLA